MLDAPTISLPAASGAPPIAAGIAVANIYYNQPMLGIIAQDFAASGATALIDSEQDTPTGNPCWLCIKSPPRGCWRATRAMWW